MLIKPIQFYSNLIFISITVFTHSQSFDIYNEKLLLKDFNYNLKENKKTTSFYDYAKTSKIENLVNELLDPIIKLHSSEKLKLSFDILENAFLEIEATSYAYTFIHCNSDWERSNITQSEYLEGFFDNYINDYHFSFNTLSSYVHYECIFPNENINFKKSGNYIILVYDTEKNIPVLTKRFIIYEDLLEIDIDVKRATLSKDLDLKHEIDFYIREYDDLNIVDVNNELKIIIQKNDDWNDIIQNCTPNFISKEVLEYDYQGELSFLAGNEYRDFDIKSLRYYGKNIKSINQQFIQANNFYYVDLQTDKINTSKYYKFKYDLNGKYIISISENKDKNTEADYALVKFVLESDYIEQYSIYIYGELTNWDILPSAKMNYDKTENQYYGFLYLKQGYYNYQYIIQDKNKNIKLIEGDYQETRNEYSIYIYHTPPWSDYDRLVGIAKSTSNALN